MKVKMKSYHQRGGFKFGVNETTRTYYTPGEAFIKFLGRVKQASTLTDTSVSCITLLLTADFPEDGPDLDKNPYIHVRRGLFGKPMNKILLKFMPTGYAKTYPTINGIRRSSGLNYIEVNTVGDIRDEAQNQLDIYSKSNKSDMNLLDPYVPAIIGLLTTVRQELLFFIRDKLHDVYGSSFEFDFVNNLIETFKTASLSIILMEFMEGYTTYNNAITSQPGIRQRYNTFVLHELVKLRNDGLIHVDSHGGNLMINATTDYFMSGTAGSPFGGRALIIDFGRVLKTSDPRVRGFIAEATRHGLAEPSFTMYVYSRCRTLDPYMVNALAFMNNELPSATVTDASPFMTLQTTYGPLFNQLQKARLTYSLEYRSELISKLGRLQPDIDFNQVLQTSRYADEAMGLGPAPSMFPTITPVVSTAPAIAPMPYGLGAELLLEPAPAIAPMPYGLGAELLLEPAPAIGSPQFLPPPPPRGSSSRGGSKIESKLINSDAEAILKYDLLKGFGKPILLQDVTITFDEKRSKGGKRSKTRKSSKTKKTKRNKIRKYKTHRKH
jgi:hypothetical protein